MGLQEEGGEGSGATATVSRSKQGALPQLHRRVKFRRDAGGMDRSGWSG